jgi:hypothetical protein
MSVQGKQARLIFFASVGIDLVAVVLLLALVNVAVGVVAAVVVLVMEYSVYRLLFRPAIIRDKLLARGEPGEAKIVRIDKSGLTTGGPLQRVSVSLEVHPGAGEPYKLDTSVLVERGQLPALTPGATIPVVIDPADGRKIAVGGPKGDKGLATSSEDKLREAKAMVEASEAKNRDVLESGAEAQKAQVSPSPAAPAPVPPPA